MWVDGGWKVLLRVVKWRLGDRSQKMRISIVCLWDSISTWGWASWANEHPGSGVQKGGERQRVRRNLNRLASGQVYHKRPTQVAETRALP